MVPSSVLPAPPATCHVLHSNAGTLASTASQQGGIRGALKHSWRSKLVSLWSPAQSGLVSSRRHRLVSINAVEGQYTSDGGANGSVGGGQGRRSSSGRLSGARPHQQIPGSGPNPAAQHRGSAGGQQGRPAPSVAQSKRRMRPGVEVLQSWDHGSMGSSVGKAPPSVGRAPARTRPRVSRRPSPAVVAT